MVQLTTTMRFHRLMRQARIHRDYEAWHRALDLIEDPAFTAEASPRLQRVLIRMASDTLDKMDGRVR